MGGLYLGLGVSAFFVGGFTFWGWGLAFFLLGCCSVLLILSSRVVLRMGLAIPSSFGKGGFVFFGLGVSAFLVGGLRFVLGVYSVLLILSYRVVLRMGLAIPSPFGFSSHSYNSGDRISW